MIKPNPFTPQSGWEPRVFGGRREQLDRFVGAIGEAVGGRPNHLVILGEWGIGKTSLLKQFKKIAQGKGYPAALCSITRFTERESCADGINLISQEISSGFPGTARKINDIKFFDFAGRSGQRPPQKQLTEFLLQVWKRLNTKLAVVLLDDVQNLRAIPRVVDILRAVLSKDGVIQNSRYLFVFSSTPEGWSAFIDKHDPIGRFFRRREPLGNLTEDESMHLIDDTLKGSGVSFDPKVKAEIFKYTRGHPYELQLLSGHLYEAQIEGKVAPCVWDSAFKNTLRELGKDYFESLFRRASERERVVLEILADAKTAMSIADIRSIMIVEKRTRNFPIANIKNFLYRLESKGLVRRSEDGNFRILDPMFAEFLTTFKL